MPFCTNCGVAIGERDQFCANCGTRQSASAPGSRAAADLRPNQLAAGCYFPWIGWLASIFVLASDRFRSDRYSRFHAFQGLYLFVAWLIFDWVFAQGGWFGLHLLPVRLIKTAFLATQLFLAFKVYHNESVRLPILSELADKSVAEQR